MIPVMVAAISSDTMDVGELSDFVEEELSAKLTGITGVASVDIAGTVDREMHVVLLSLIHIYVSGNTPPCSFTMACAAFCRLRARL